MEAAMLALRVYPVEPYQTNSYLVAWEPTQHAILVDPGGQAEDLLRLAEPVRVTHILLTHGHPDHVGALEEVRRSLDVPVGIHPADAEAFGLHSDFALQAGQKLPLGEAGLEVIPIPGHTSGSVALRLADDGEPPRAIVGDAIFPGGPGYTATPADLALSLDSLARTVFTWPDETLLYPGHGIPTTVGAERAAFEAFRAKALPEDLCGDVSWRELE
jgi:glyoxylase-like metal-dependent hydrolase (beta-lactamase superfamily II)